MIYPCSEKRRASDKDLPVMILAKIINVLTTEFMITPQCRPKTDQPSQEKRSYEVTKRKKKEGGENWIRPRYSS